MVKLGQCRQTKLSVFIFLLRGLKKQTSETIASLHSYHGGRTTYMIIELSVTRSLIHDGNLSEKEAKIYHMEKPTNHNKMRRPKREQQVQKDGT